MSEISLPNQWVATALDEVVDKIVGGGTPSKAIPSYFQGNIPWMTVKDMNKFVLDDTVDHISEEAVENSATNIIPAGTPIIATRMSLGKLVRANFDSAINQDLKAIFVNENVSKIYFEYWYRSIAQKIQEMGTGTTVKGIRLEDIKQLSFALAPLAEQQQIAQKLDELLAQVDTLKTRLDAIPKILKRFRQSVLAAAVSGRLTEGWRDSNEIEYDYAVEKLSNLINEMRNGLSVKPNEQGFGVPILRISSVRSLFVDQVDVRFLELDEVEVQRYSLKPEDLLFTRYNGSLEFVGVCGQVRKLSHENLVYPDKLIRVRVNKEKIIPSYLELYYASSDVREFVMSLVKSTSGQKGISGQDLKDMNICFPSVVEQTEIVRRVEQLFAYADQIEQRVKDAQARVNHLTQSILAKAFRGELTAEWRAQNPALISGENSAAALLERIKAEREVAGKVKKKKA